ncbi:MAG TPA: hypothetical protein VFP96_18250 [Candidatus Acidoferrum sp.]|nr:hypothetical protein [Candidatus Acidoferrum sp.]
MNQLQDLVDQQKIEGTERGWDLQEMARYVHAFDRDRSNELQIAAHQLNRHLLKPQNGMVFEPISAKGQKRIERIMAWVKDFASAEDLLIEVDAITTNLRFGVGADDFEAAIDRLGKAFGRRARTDFWRTTALGNRSAISIFPQPRPPPIYKDQNPGETENRRRVQCDDDGTVERDSRSLSPIRNHLQGGA